MRAEDFKKQFSLVEYVKQHFDYEDRGDEVAILCPFHSESTPSCVISELGWYCFGACGCGGDGIDFLMKVTGASFKEVINNPDILATFPAKVNNQQRTKREKTGHVSPSLIKNYQSRLLRQPFKIQYLENRGFDLPSIRLSYIGYGIPVDVFGWKFRHPRFVIPHFKDGKIVGVKYRIDPLYEQYESEKYISHPGTTGTLYNIDIFNEHDKIIYVGSQFDAAVLWYRYAIPAVCPPSENTFKDEWIPLFINKSILIWLDNDDTGETSALKAYRKIKGVTKSADVFIWDKSVYKPKDDFTDFLKKEGIDKVRSLYAQL